MTTSKYEPVTLPETKAAALTMAADREEWARIAYEQDRLGSTRELELTALLLRFYAEQLGDDDLPDITDEMLDHGDWCDGGKLK